MNLEGVSNVLLPDSLLRIGGFPLYLQKVPPDFTAVNRDVCRMSPIEQCHAAYRSRNNYRFLAVKAGGTNFILRHFNHTTGSSIATHLTAL